MEALQVDLSDLKSVDRFATELGKVGGWVVWVGGWAWGLLSIFLSLFLPTQQSSFEPPRPPLPTPNPPTHPPTHPIQRVDKVDILIKNAGGVMAVSYPPTHPPTLPYHPAAHSNRLVLLYPHLTHPPTHPYNRG